MSTVISLLSLLAQVSLAAPQTPVNPYVECEPLLRQHIQKATDVRPWKELPGDLVNAKEATVLIRLPLGLGDGVRLAALSHLVEDGSGVSIPEPLKIVTGFGLFSVARGSQQSLLKLHNKIKTGLPGAAVKYQILGYSQLHDFSVPFPDHIYRDEAAVADLIEKEGEAFVAFSRVRGGQLLFFIPRRQLGPLMNTESLEGSRITQYHLRVPPRDWAAWMEEKAGFFNGKGLVLGSYWAVLSAKALEALKELEADYNARNTPRAAQITAAFDRALERCFGEVCPVEASAEPEDTITYAARVLILDFLRDHRKSVPVSAANGVRQAFLALGDLIPDERARAVYLQTIRNLPFTTYEYTSVAKDDAVTNLAIERLILAWRAFLKARGLPQANQPLTIHNIRHAIEAIEP